MHYLSLLVTGLAIVAVSAVLLLLLSCLAVVPVDRAYRARRKRHARDAERPPAIPGIAAMRPEDARTLTRWTLRSYPYRVLRRARLSRWREAPESGVDRVVSLIAGVVSLPLYPTSVVTSRALLLDPRARYYRDDHAVIAIKATGQEWVVEDHVCERPGTGQGHDLREAVFAAAKTRADSTGAPITLTTPSRTLMKAYQRHLPGLEEVGRTPLLKYKCRYEPASE